MGSRDEHTATAPERVIVDGANVVGAGAGGWWRDRAGAMRRLADRLTCYGAAAGVHVDLVLDAPDLPAGPHGSVTVHHATRRGRDAGDDRIRELLAGGDPRTVQVVTSDRALRVDALHVGAEVVGAGTFLSRLDAAGC
jgi:predicted RNA-binding protein with PIN domain